MVYTNFIIKKTEKSVFEKGIVSYLSFTTFLLLGVHSNALLYPKRLGPQPHLDVFFPSEQPHLFVSLV
jgi:hypothetical protein